MGWYLIVATIPAVIIGLMCKDYIEITFTNATATGYFLLLTSALLILAEAIGNKSCTIKDISWLKAWWIGFFQVFALFPGVSRSGATIAGGMTRNLNRASAAKFSFLMSIPVTCGAGILALKDLFELQAIDGFIGPLVMGFLAAMFSGYVAIRWLIRYLKTKSLGIFALYCFVLGILAIWIS